MDTMPADTVLATREEYLAAVDRARDAAAEYYTSGEIVMDDATYDALVRSIAEAEGDHPEWAVDRSPATTVAAGAVSGDVEHAEPMLSLDNVFSPTELESWVAGLERRLGRPVDGWVVEPKLDGLAIAARYRNGALEQLVTRGDGQHGEDVTYAAKLIDGLPGLLTHSVDIEVRGEVLFTDAQFEAANLARAEHGDRPFVNARNGAAGALRGAAERSYPIWLTFYGYGVAGSALEASIERDPATGRHSDLMGWVHDLGVQTTSQSAAGLATFADLDGVLGWIGGLSGRRAALRFAVDGAVIKADNPADRAEAGEGSRAPRWGIAYKYPPDTAISVLEEVIWQVGRTGVITPRARITPVFVSGTTITYATLHNPGDVARKDFRIGDKVTVVRAGEVIPRLEAPVVNLRTGDEHPVTAPVTCPRCESAIDRSQERWRCVRGRACGLAESIRYAASRDALDIEGLGTALVDQLVERGIVADIAELFTLDRDALASLDRMGETSADNLLTQIEKARSAALARLLTALGIRGTGRSMSRRIAAHFGTMATIRVASAADFEAVDGIGAEKAPVIVAELADLSDVIDKLAAAGVRAAGDSETRATSPGTDGGVSPLAGKTVVVSGAMSGRLAGLSRTEMNELIEAAGGRASGSVSKNTDYLVTAETTTGKAVKAAALGVAVLTPDEFAEMVGR